MVYLQKIILKPQEEGPLKQCVMGQDIPSHFFENPPLVHLINIQYPNSRHLGDTKVIINKLCMNVNWLSMLVSIIHFFTSVSF